MSDLLTLAADHLRLVLIAVSIGAVTGLPLGALAAHHAGFRRIALGGASLVQTIPGLALLAIMVPAFAAFARATGLPLSSIGVGPALVALSVYALLPLIRGVVVGVDSIERSIIAAADAVGMTSRQRLLAVELPLALPHILAGVRTATVWTVGMATLATPVGASSLGNLIFAGLQTRSPGDVARGCASAAALALTLDALLASVERRAKVPGRAGRPTRWFATGFGLLLLMAFALLFGSGGRGPERLQVGAKTFTEQFILSEIIAAKLAPFGPTSVRSSLGSSVAFDALKAGDLDVYVDYTGTLWTTLLHRSDALSPSNMRRELAARLSREYRVRLLCALGFENAYALVVRNQRAERSITDLGPGSQLRFGGDYEFFARPEWAALRSHYGLSPSRTVTMDPSLLYAALAEKQVDVIAGYTTDGRIDALQLRVLTDDRRAIPPYDAVVLASEHFVVAHSEAARALTALEGTIDAAQMRSMNNAVDRDGRKAGAVAQAFLRHEIY